jgi:hypothetical protein
MARKSQEGKSMLCKHEALTSNLSLSPDKTGKGIIVKLVSELHFSSPQMDLLSLFY